MGTSMTLWLRVVVLALCCVLHLASFDKDPYKVLGVGRQASQTEIKKVWRLRQLGWKLSFMEDQF